MQQSDRIGAVHIIQCSRCLQGLNQLYSAALAGALDEVVLLQLKALIRLLLKKLQRALVQAAEGVRLLNQLWAKYFHLIIFAFVFTLVFDFAIAHHQITFVFVFSCISCSVHFQLVPNSFTF